MSVWPDLSSRSREPELLDLGGVPHDEVRRSLGDLRFVNRWLGGRKALWSALHRPLSEARARSTPLSVLDVGCGSADLPAWLQDSHGRSVRVFGLDLKHSHLREAPPSVHRVAGDVFRAPFAEQAFDVVTCSLFLHHIDEPDLPGILSSLWRLARRALIVNDLRRAQVPHAFGRLVFPWLFRSPVSVADGLVSIRRAFVDSELLAAFASAGLPVPRIRRRFPYRLIAVAERP